MKIKDLIKQLGKIKDKETSVGFGVWFGDENWAKGHKIFWDGGSRSVRLLKHNGLNVAVVGYADNCLAHTFSEQEAKTRKVIGL